MGGYDIVLPCDSLMVISATLAEACVLLRAVLVYTVHVFISAIARINYIQLYSPYM